MEDIDATFTQGITRDISGTDLEDLLIRNLLQRDDDGDPKDDPNNKQIEDEVAVEGLILIATTNRYHAPDPALTRPGRMGPHVEFRLASRYQARELYRCFYIPDTSEAEAASTDDDNDSENDDVPSDSGSTLHSPSTPKLSRKLVEHLAEGFASRIPEREFSMASLQGYLTSYKTHHFQAVDDVDQWIEDTRETRDGRTEVRALRVQR
ncbi:hypothetical protein EDB89DRAFT_1379443 [Lactarius sanguifluus]|nr:hypothetical protein EDB89DRAFT_1379443 [Lactarius sanguifluus]